MSVYEDEWDDEKDQPEQRTDAEWAKLRRAEKAAKQAAAEADKARRELAFYKAGLSPDDPKTSYFIKGYEGDLDAEKIRSAAAEAGFLQPAAEDEVDAAPLEADARIADAVGGVEGVDASALDALAESYRQNGMDGIVETLRSAGALVNDVQG